MTTVSEPVRTATPAPTGAIEPEALPVRPGEGPWTPEEVAEVLQVLDQERDRLTEELDRSRELLASLGTGDGSGDDTADAGDRIREREGELVRARRVRDLLDETEEARGRLYSGTFGACSGCGQAIGRLRLRAFPRATLCVSCKQLQERR